MLFSSITFLYYFLPLLLAVYFVTPKKFKNLILLIFSLIFYAWGEPVYITVMIISAAIAYLFGLLIHKYRKTSKAKILMIFSIMTQITILVIFKYLNFLIQNLDLIPHVSIPLLNIHLPVGISFYTFQILSYTIDLYLGRTKIQKSLVSFVMYVSFFPQLIAGPIVRYSDIERDLNSREHSLYNFAYGANRFVIGLAKKVIIADSMASLCKIYTDSSDKSILFVWIYIIAYGIHIYFDFSGYSDMAIGLGKIFGFHFPENFDYPYIAKNITEFWRRWHMTLGSWFRDYVYIPLGGNKVGAFKYIFNIALVWSLTGIWHGASWTFICWGLYFAVILLSEKFILKKCFPYIPIFFKHLYTILLLMIGWVIFDADNIEQAIFTISMMFGNESAVPLYSTESFYYLRSYMIPILIGIIGCTPLPKLLVNKLNMSRFNIIVAVLEPVNLAILLIIVTGYLVDGSFNPFIYFKF